MRAGVWSGTAMEHAWRKIRDRIGLHDVRIHDLRRTAASWLAINGSNIPVIQSMLNHRPLASIQVYARLSVEPVHLALDDQAKRILRPVAAPVMAQPISAPVGRMEWSG